MNDLDALRTKLESVTTSAEKEDFFLEHSRTRELEYSRRSVRRWAEIIGLIEGIDRRERCLDIGTSPLTFVLRDYFKEVSTLDYSESFAQRCKRGGISHYSGGIMSAVDKVPADHFDCITFLEVLEHLHLNPIHVISYLKSKLRPGGVLILSTPNMMSSGNRIRMLLNRKLDDFTYPPFAENEHPAHGHMHDRIYMPAELDEYFASMAWSSYEIGFHSTSVSEPPGRGIFQTALRAPINMAKVLVPSLRKFILVRAVK